ncbi:uncharacterized protein DMENIID0001_051670 [Sergentomyia squamirostris]
MDNSSGSGFENKRKLLFDSLSTAEKAIKGTILEQNDSTSERNRQSLARPKVDKKNDARQVLKFRGRESIFKRPEAPISQCLRRRQRPDYQVNPEKWTKYTLDDVDTSEQTNTAAAFAFLAECERRRDEEDQATEMTTDEDSTKVVFRKSSKLRKIVEEKEKDEKSTNFRASKVVMPEYVVGQVKKREKKPKTSTETSAKAKKEMKLDHLFENEDE